MPSKWLAFRFAGLFTIESPLGPSSSLLTLRVTADPLLGNVVW
jgi:hypothetical protein